MGLKHEDSKLPMTTLVMASDLSSVPTTEDVILQHVGQHKFTEEAIFAIKLTLEEALTNAIKHGNNCDVSKKVTIRYYVDDEQVLMYIRDEGTGFDPDHVPDPTSPERLALPSGRGILLMRAYMDDVEYLCNGTELFFRKLNN